MAENNAKTRRRVAFSEMNTGENEKSFRRFSYLEKGEYIVNTDVLEYDENDLLTVEFSNEISKIMVYISSFDGVAYTTPYKSEYENTQFHLSKVTAHTLKGAVLKNANAVVRKAQSWEQAVRDLRATFGVTFKVKVTPVKVGTETPNVGDDVAVSRLWAKNGINIADQKLYEIKGVKHLYSIEKVD